MAELPPPPDGIVLTHFIVSDDVERSRRFYTEVLAARIGFDMTIPDGAACTVPTARRNSPVRSATCRSTAGCG
jgi:catechol 2,3-dioxygenase-like lactoylglutathione lyase family enzyme